MSHMLPEGEVMRRVACADVCPAPTLCASSENKELLRQQLLSASKERSAEKSEQPKPKHRNRQKNRWKLKFHHQALPQEYLDHYEQSLQKANAKQKQKEKPKPEPALDVNNITNEAFKVWAQRLASIQNNTVLALSDALPTSMMPLRQDRTEDKRKKNPAIAPSKIVTYDDLPYMGEMTLNNSKPRRGRKPKKADICHLIYENYGTVVPGQPSPREGLNLVPSPFREPINPKTDLQNKIISNLMERKLSQENKRRMENASPSQYSTPALIGHDEPLNLCIRDLRDLKIQIQKKFGNIYTSLLDVKSDDADNSDPESCKSEQPNAISVIQRNTSICPPAPSPLQDADTKLVLKQITDLLDPKLIDRLEDAKKSPEAKMKRASPNPIQGPVKRKRSAIFIPPVPTKSNSTTPTTEVSICKFKFTGGSKPSLQEKKMLSVDSGGNFRYYSGGNKGNKGYEYLQNNQARSQQTGELSVDTKPKEGFKEEESKKKRKSRKSLQREKLEQTFKEKGFLIQTQQLQSAEGATYCKFRQLRKFTRYLFRSWKDYLPGELEEKPTENNEVRDTAGDWS
ncbi:uncharacterized protein LOC101741865 isoform X3 [Bombyx mori]|uniref:Uncharacterized protein n=1 Tax=Bombyx mori TaxID=7091 RepID=A0A8R2QSP0_BOMMO|nr:uncharacterized protein LOC101741865 isoform X2 [Bombyx mori]